MEDIICKLNINKEYLKGMTNMKPIMRITAALLLAVIVIGLFPFSQSGLTTNADSGVITVTGGTVNVRKAPSTSADVIAKVYKNETYEYKSTYVGGDKVKWYLITVGPSTGWIISTYVKATSGGTVKTTTTAAPASKGQLTAKRDGNIYASPTKSAKVAGTVEAEAKYNFSSRYVGGDGVAWYLVKLPSGATGWICSTEVRISSTSTTAYKTTTTTSKTTEATATASTVVSGTDTTTAKTSSTTKKTSTTTSATTTKKTTTTAKPTTTKTTTTAASGTAMGKVTITASSAKTYASPTKSATVVATVSKGKSYSYTSIYIGGDAVTWYLIKVGTKTCWICDKDIKDSEQASKLKITTTTKGYGKPTTSDTPRVTITSGTYLKFNSTYKGGDNVIWFLVTINGSTVWICSSDARDPASLSSSTPVKISTATAYAYTSSSTSSDVAIKLYRGQTVQCTKTYRSKDNVMWYKITLGDYSGWISSANAVDWSAINTTKTISIPVASATAYSSPTASSTAIFKVFNTASVAYTSTYKGGDGVTWYLVSCGGKTAWLSGSHSADGKRSPNGDAYYVYNPDYKTPYYIVVYIGSQTVVVYSKDENGKYTNISQVFTCSTGAVETPTRTGSYSVLRKYRWHLMMGTYAQYCSAISRSYLFHSILYKKADPSTLSANSYRNLGKQASHGCIRLCTRDAKWIYDNCDYGTQVRIVSAAGPKAAPLPPLNTSSTYQGWDPTDPAANNPYNK